MKEQGPGHQEGASHEWAALPLPSQPLIALPAFPFHRDFGEGRAALVVSEKDSPLQKRQHPELPHKVSDREPRGSYRTKALSPGARRPPWLGRSQL